MTDLELATRSALQRIAASTEPDLARMSATALRAGRRLRHRRRVTAGAGLFAVMGSASALALGSGGPQPDGPQVATDPAPTPSAPTTAPEPSPTPAPTPAGPQLPVRFVGADGWSCDAFPIDQKMSCTSTSGGNLSVVVRPASQYDAFINDSDKMGPGVGVDQPRGNYFVTYQGTYGATKPSVLLNGLRYDDTWADAPW